MKGRRDKVFLATKFCVSDGHLPNDTPVPKIIEARRRRACSRLQTDHVDLIHIHSCDRVERLLAPNIHEAFDRLKEQGKVALPRRQHPHAEPRGGRERGDRLRPLRRA